MAIARFPTIVLDCPDARGARALLRRTARLGGDDGDDGQWVDVRSDYGQSLCFQPVADYRAPVWPGQDVPQQMHLDVVVDDLDAAEAAVLALGATKHDAPAGHDLPGLPRPGRPPVLPVPQLTSGALS